MKNYHTFAANFAFVFAVVLFGCQNAAAQLSFAEARGATRNDFAEEVRPFDFSDKYYYENGLEPSLLVNRRNGDDKLSVVDAISDPRFRGVRVTGVFPAYNQDGKMIYFNLYSELFKNGFRRDAAGETAAGNAYFSPIFIFPSKIVDGGPRQASIINLRGNYFEKNPLGLSVQVIVEFTDRIETEDGKLEMETLTARNGASVDGTPILKTVDEIEDLTRKQLVTQKIKSVDDGVDPSFAVAKVMRNPERGAISPDAKLLMPLDANRRPPESEFAFVRHFICLKETGQWRG